MKWFVKTEPEITTEYAGTRIGDYYTNPDVLLETEILSNSAFYNTFGYGSPELKTVNVNCLFYAVACILGAEIIFPEDSSPQIKNRSIKNLSDINKLKIPEDITDTGYLKDVIKNYEYLKKREVHTGVVPLFNIPGQSPLGTATILRGTDLFLDIMTEPKAVKDLLEIITLTAIKVIKFEEEYTGKKTELIAMDDDYGGLVSPDVYEEFNFPYIKRMYDAFHPKERYLHSESLSRKHLKFIPQLEITEFDSWPYADLTVEGVKEALPNSYFTWNIETSKDLYSDTPKQIKEKFKHAVDIGVPGMSLVLCSRRVPKENIKAFIDTASTH